MGTIGAYRQIIGGQSMRALRCDQRCTVIARKERVPGEIAKRTGSFGAK
jgi:hypothetical protein